eukprot:710563-Hanusia_phi.AAC.1
MTLPESWPSIDFTGYTQPAPEDPAFTSRAHLSRPGPDSVPPARRARRAAVPTPGPVTGPGLPAAPRARSRVPDHRIGSRAL